MLASIPAAREPDTGGLEAAGTSLKGTPMTTTHADLRYATVDGQGLLHRQYGAEHGGVPIVLLSRFQGTIDDWDPRCSSRPGTMLSETHHA